MTKKKEVKKDEGVTIELKLIRDTGVEGEGRIRFVFPDKPKEGAGRALNPSITGAVWIKKGSIIPDKLVITFPKEEEEKLKKGKKKDEADDNTEKDLSGEFV
jgi:hypothetical protein